MAEIAIRWFPLDLSDDKSIRQQAIIWANVDLGLCHHMPSPVAPFTNMV